MLNGAEFRLPSQLSGFMSSMKLFPLNDATSGITAFESPKVFASDIDRAFLPNRYEDSPPDPR